MHLPPQRVDLRLGRGGVQDYQSPLVRMVLQFPDKACYFLDGVEDVHAEDNVCWFNLRVFPVGPDEVNVADIVGLGLL